VAKAAAAAASGGGAQVIWIWGVGATAVGRAARVASSVASSLLFFLPVAAAPPSTISFCNEPNNNHQRSSTIFFTLATHHPPPLCFSSRLFEREGGLGSRSEAKKKSGWPRRRLSVAPRAGRRDPFWAVTRSACGPISARAPSLRGEGALLRAARRGFFLFLVASLPLSLSLFSAPAAEGLAIARPPQPAR
jgi:hypothetical protein